ncbi:pseudouridine synthase [Clostridium thermosuccinogenes]|jgi:23S rRNA pseudouridine2605 synthase|uniref:Pseudouridine synthase n=1 Tax=Clostridium thermosuccinogenes TaxID=84032 RepID=A0A2K2F2U8_9CLOT|nr:pseudouridine synthase [Pseudoclostridium thermosuccinogenes]AUS96236.1 pseudouridine synthase [Pseudoclostridium thermosuccinogenes]PNT93084.1 pseudouridine synthase [Pseudoclostridium thermosuccinogenes]PNT96389.1 pseudouridine synthase [Pseudoclostridium thermosuccinogenes]PNT98042.1 pseudouridine synthase [Pseudoclostridium thermosuccinogenes]
MDKMRLQKYIAECGVASRRKSEELIKQGRVKVNGIPVSEMGVKVSDEDVVEVDGRRISLEQKKVYIMLNKPVGYISSVRDQFSRNTVVDLIKGVKERIYPVGRLDYDTSGLLLLTNDGDFAFRLTHPKHEMKKTYIAEVEGVPDSNDIESFQNGLRIEDYVTSPAELTVLEKKKSSSMVKVVIHEGKNRQVRKMCDAIGHPVISLKRIAIGDLYLKGLPEGQWRYLKEEEIKMLG